MEPADIRQEKLKRYDGREMGMAQFMSLFCDILPVGLKAVEA